MRLTILLDPTIVVQETLLFLVECLKRTLCEESWFCSTVSCSVLVKFWMLEPGPFPHLWKSLKSIPSLEYHMNNFIEKSSR